MQGTLSGFVNARAAMLSKCPGVNCEAVIQNLVDALDAKVFPNTECGTHRYTDVIKMQRADVRTLIISLIRNTADEGLNSDLTHLKVFVLKSATVQVQHIALIEQITMVTTKPEIFGGRHDENKIVIRGQIAYS